MDVIVSTPHPRPLHVRNIHTEVAGDHVRGYPSRADGRSFAQALCGEPFSKRADALVCGERCRNRRKLEQRRALRAA